MLKSQLILLFKGLNKQELNEFVRYVKSPFFNKNQRIIKLTQYIAKYFPDFDSPKLSKDVVAKKVLGAEGGSRALAYVMSDLKKLLEDYLVWKEVQTKPIDRDYFLLRNLSIRSNQQSFIAISNRQTDRLEEYGKKDMFYYYHQFRLHHLLLAHKTAERISNSVDDLEQAMKNLDRFYFMAKLQYACEISNREGIFANKKPYEVLFMDEIKSITSKAPFTDNLLFESYQLYNDLIKDFNEDKYRRLKEIIRTKRDIFGAEEELEFYILMINYGLTAYDSGETHYLEEVFEWYQFGLETKLLMKYDFIEHIDYNNIVNVACTLKQFDWIDGFIEKYTPFLKEEFRENAKTLSLAEVAVNKGDFEQALDLLQAVDFNDDYDKLRAKVMQMKGYFELEEFDMLLLNFFDAFSVFLRRNKTFTEDFRQSYLNLINFSRRLFKMKQLAPRERNFEDLKKRFKELENLPYRSWIARKLQQLEV